VLASGELLDVWRASSSVPPLVMVGAAHLLAGVGEASEFGWGGRSVGGCWWAMQWICPGCVSDGRSWRIVGLLVSFWGCGERELVPPLVTLKLLRGMRGHPHRLAGCAVLHAP
jgi:hypothetical protein